MNLDQMEDIILNAREVFVKDRYAIAITSMKRVGKDIFLGLTGRERLLAKYNIERDAITFCPELFPQTRKKRYCGKLHNAIGTLDDGSLILGEGNHFDWDGIPVCASYLEKELPAYMLDRKRNQGYPDLKYSDFCLESLHDWCRETDDPGGLIVRYYPDTEKTEIIAKLPQYMYVQSLVVDPKRKMAYGTTIPDNHFFVVDIEKKTLRDCGRISEYAQHNMVVAPNGICYGAYKQYAKQTVCLLRFDPDKGQVEYTGKVILQDAGQKIAGNSGIDQWIVTRDGRMFVGSVSNALFFEFDWQTETFNLIGRSSISGRVPIMEEDEEGIIWIGSGYPNMQLIRFDPNCTGKGRFTDCGVVNSLHPRCYFHASAYYDGKLYLGETDGFSPSMHIVDLKKL